MKAFTLWLTTADGSARRLTLWSASRDGALAEAKVLAQLAGGSFALL